MSVRTFKVQDPLMKGRDIEKWQEELIELFDKIAIENVPLKADGVYGHTTRSITATLCYCLGINADEALRKGVTPTLRKKLRERDLTAEEKKRYQSGSTKRFRAELRRRWAGVTLGDITTVMKSPVFRTGGYGSLGPINRVAVHHDAAKLRFAAYEMRTVIRSYDRDHTIKFGGGIGYHEIIDGEGRIWPVRAKNSKGAHVGGNNSNTYGIMLVGNFHDGTERPTEKQLTTLEARLTQKPPKGLPDLRGKKPFGHKEIINNSACPGRRFLPWVQKLRSRLA